MLFLPSFFRDLVEEEEEEEEPGGGGDMIHMHRVPPGCMAREISETKTWSAPLDLLRTPWRKTGDQRLWEKLNKKLFESKDQLLVEQIRTQTSTKPPPGTADQRPVGRQNWKLPKGWLKRSLTGVHVSNDGWVWCLAILYVFMYGQHHLELTHNVNAWETCLRNLQQTLRPGPHSYGHRTFLITDLSESVDLIK